MTRVMPMLKGKARDGEISLIALIFEALEAILTVQKKSVEQLIIYRQCREGLVRANPSKGGGAKLRILSRLGGMPDCQWQPGIFFLQEFFGSLTIDIVKHMRKLMPVRNRLIERTGQAIMEYLIIFAILAFVVTLGSTFFQGVMTSMERARNNGINLMVNR